MFRYFKDELSIRDSKPIFDFTKMKERDLISMTTYSKVRKIVLNNNVFMMLEVGI